MKIQNIKKQKDGKYKLKLDDNSSIVTYDNVILDNNLLFNSHLDDETIRKINNDNFYYDIYNETLKFASKKMRSKKEIKDFLSKYDLEEKKYDELIKRFEEIGIINDHSFVRAFIHDRMNFSNDGPFKIKEGLLKHDIDSNIIDDEFSKIDHSVFDEKRDKIMHKKIKSNSKYSNTLLKRKLNNELFLMGYNVPNLDDYFDDDSSILNKEYQKLIKKYEKKYEGEELKNLLFKKLYMKGFNKEDIKNIINGVVFK